MVTISELEGWKPADLSTVADLLVQRRTTLIDLQDEIDAGNPPDDWDGPASTGARQTQQRLKLLLNDMVAEVSSVTSSLDDAAEALGRAEGACVYVLRGDRMSRATVHPGRGDRARHGQERDRVRRAAASGVAAATLATSESTY